jgi:long-chain fatty acid transport protein
MRPKISSVNATLLSSLTFFTVSNSFAGGLILYEIGTPDLGLASAGYAARAQDAGTAMTNPAGMTRLSQTEILLGIQPFYADLKFSPNGNNTVSGNDGGNAIGIFPGGGAFVVINATSNLKFGLSSYGNFGNALEYDEGWVGRYYVKNATLLGATIAPSIAYRLHEMWSLGASFNAMYGILSTKVAFNNSPFGFFDRQDGQIKLKDTAWGFGGTFGVLFEPTQTLRFGLTYTTKIDLDFEDTLRIENALPEIIPSGSFGLPTNLGMTVPQAVMASFFYELNQDWGLLGNVGWQNWQEFGYVNVQISSANQRSAIVNLQYEDTWHIALGAQYWLSQLWRFSFGAAYDSSMVSNENRSLTTPVGSAVRLGLGAQYFVCENFNFGLGYTFLWGGDLTINQNRGLLTGHVAGEFKNTNIQFIGLNFDWKF